MRARPLLFLLVLSASFLVLLGSACDSRPVVPIDDENPRTDATPATPDVGPRDDAEPEASAADASDAAEADAADEDASDAADASDS